MNAKEEHKDVHAMEDVTTTIARYFVDYRAMEDLSNAWKLAKEQIRYGYTEYNGSGLSEDVKETEKSDEPEVIQKQPSGKPCKGIVSLLRHIKERAGKKMTALFPNSEQAGNTAVPPIPEWYDDAEMLAICAIRVACPEYFHKLFGKGSGAFRRYLRAQEIIATPYNEQRSGNTGQQPVSESSASRADAEKQLEKATGMEMPELVHELIEAGCLCEWSLFHAVIQHPKNLSFEAHYFVSEALNERDNEQNAGIWDYSYNLQEDDIKQILKFFDNHIPADVAFHDPQVLVAALAHQNDQIEIMRGEQGGSGPTEYVQRFKRQLRQKMDAWNDSTAVININSYILFFSQVFDLATSEGKDVLIDTMKYNPDSSTLDLWPYALRVLMLSYSSPDVKYSEIEKFKYTQKILDFKDHTYSSNSTVIEPERHEIRLHIWNMSIGEDEVFPIADIAFESFWNEQRKYRYSTSVWDKYSTDAVKKYRHVPVRYRSLQKAAEHYQNDERKASDVLRCLIDLGWFAWTEENLTCCLDVLGSDDSGWPKKDSMDISHILQKWPSKFNLLKATNNDITDTYLGTYFRWCCRNGVYPFYVADDYDEANDGAIENMRETWLQLSALDLLNLDTFNVFTDEPNVSVLGISGIGRLLGKCVNGKIEKMDVIWNAVLKDGSNEILPIDFVYKKHLGEPLNPVYELLRRSVNADFIERYVKETDRKTWGRLLDLVSSDKSINTQDKNHIVSMLAELR